MELMLPFASWHPNPYDASAGRELSLTPPQEEESIAEYLDRVGWDAPIDTYAVAYLDGRFVPKEQWLDTVFQPAQRLSVHAAHAGGGDSDFGRILATILVVIAAFYAPYLLNLAPGSFAAVASSAAVMVGGQLLVNSIFPMSTREPISGAAQDPTYSLSGGSNSLRPYEPLPIVVGKHRVFADLDEKPFTYFENNDQILTQTFNFGLGDLVLTDHRIGESALEDLGISALEYDKAYVTNVDSEPGNELKFSTGWVTRTSPVDTTEIAIDVSGILVSYNNKGEETNLTASFSIEYSVHGSGSWTPVASLPDVITGYTPITWEYGPIADPENPNATKPAGEGWELYDAPEYDSPGF